MQKSWVQDPKKSTFIVHDMKIYKDAVGAGAMTCQDAEVASMIGDVNMFLGDDGEGEVSLMVAEMSHRRRGVARRLLPVFFAYTRCHLGVKTVRAKIGLENSASLKLFQERLGFEEESRSSVFGEVTLMRALSKDDATEEFDLTSYDDFCKKHSNK